METILSGLSCSSRPRCQKTEIIRLATVKNRRWIGDRGTFKEALPEVSKVRLEQTLFAEYPEVRKWLLDLRNKKTEQDISTLTAIWGTSEEETLERASKLVEIGFFVKRTEKESPTYWVPFLYRDALEMVQGRAEEADDEIVLNKFS